MTCSKAEDAVMLYHEKRIKPFKSLALYRHVNKCECCRKLFLAINRMSELEMHEAPEGLKNAVMAKIPTLSTPAAPAKQRINRTQLAHCLYALLLAVGMAILLNTEGYHMVDAYFLSLDHSIQAITSFMSDMLGGYVNHILILAVTTILAAIGIDVGSKAEVQVK